MPPIEQPRFMERLGGMYAETYNWELRSELSLWAGCHFSSPLLNQNQAFPSMGLRREQS